MDYSSKVIINAKLHTPSGRCAVCGSRMKDLTVIPNAAIGIENGIISFVTPMPELGALSPDAEVIDACGHAVIPGFIDSHTHLLFGGNRAEEFKCRLEGESYMSIMQRGGGIQSTVNATRCATVGQLIENAEWLLDKMLEMGVTTVEVKSGYGLDTETEIKMLDTIGKLRSKRSGIPDIAATFMGAHAVPNEYKSNPEDYISLIIDEMIPAVNGKAEFFDIFTEKGVFGIEESRRMLEAARQAGFKLKVHADEIVSLGGAELAAEIGAVSADHLLHVSDRGIEEMERAGVVATLLPLTAFALKEPFAPARRFIDHGCAVALATDLNPGSCFSGSIPLTIALACIHMGMTIEEVITALTLNGASALGMAEERGSVEIGKRADILILHYDTIDCLPYFMGMNCVDTVIAAGNVIHNQSQKNLNLQTNYHENL